ncbi:MAG: hypothetical protein FJX68_02450 [Alphaproteobacteria bacterium]|nr:hypothetical protein [Alphaproteobacteria bacterium]
MGVEDYWATLAEFFDKHGDREDYAIAKYLTLKAAGVPALVLLLALFALVLGKCWRAARAGDGLAQAAVAAGALAAAHAALDFPLQIPALGLTFAFLLGTGFGRAALLVKPSKPAAAVGGVETAQQAGLPRQRVADRP